MLRALPAFWVGLLYDETALDAAWELVKDWTAEERQAAARRGAALALRARSAAAPCARSRATASPRRAGPCPPRQTRIGGRDETRYLAPLERSWRAGQTLAEELIEKFKGEWGGSVEPAFTELALL